MSITATTDILNRLFMIHSWSLPVFLAESYPTWRNRPTRAAEVLADIVDDQRAIAAGAGRLIVDQNGVVAASQFPARFSSFHDLSYDFLLSQLIGYQDQTIVAITRLVAQLPPDSPAETLAQEALGMARAHRDALGELQGASAGGRPGHRPDTATQ
ncbi:MAG: hypothetical protein GXY58_03115 [Planctomycetaceae bacterium]|nr:hypothetical protein [Planctomycetaceae bacterium]